MKRITYEDLLSPENIKLLKNAVFQDQLIIYPTDTLYGLGGNFFSLKAIEKIDALKKRTDMPYSVIVTGIEMLRGLVDHIPEVFQSLYPRLLPGKFTFLFHAAKTIDPALVKGRDKIGIRIPNTPHILKLVDMLEAPLITTSVNRSGEPPLNDPEIIFREFSVLPPDLSPAVLIDAGVLPESKGSTILDITQSPVNCLRKGDDFDKISDLL